MTRSPSSGSSGSEMGCAPTAIRWETWRCSRAGRPAYRIPAPVVVQADGTQVPGAARFELRGDRLLLHARGLDGLKYPINIDPSLEITDFVPGGNDEGGVGFEGGRVVRSRSARGVGAWSSTSGLPEPRSGHCSVAYGGRLYVLGGQNSGPMREVYVAPISTSGAVGPFVATTPLPSQRESLGCAAYDNFLYAVGGRASSGVTAEVLVATIQADGSVGAWKSIAPPSVSSTRAWSRRASRTPVCRRWVRRCSAVGGIRLSAPGGRNPGALALSSPAAPRPRGRCRLRVSRTSVRGGRKRRHELQDRGARC